VPAPAVIPAPRAYINVAAVKKLVVGRKSQGCGWVRWLKASAEGCRDLLQYAEALSSCGSGCLPKPP
jgi:hypothetical protein